MVCSVSVGLGVVQPLTSHAWFNPPESFGYGNEDRVAPSVKHASMGQ